MRLLLPSEGKKQEQLDRVVDARELAGELVSVMQRGESMRKLTAQSQNSNGSLPPIQPAERRASTGVQRRVTGASMMTEAEYDDARSYLSSETEGRHSYGIQLPYQPTLPLPPWVPNPPLEFAEPGTVYVPVPAVTGFVGYWQKDPARTTPAPLPLDDLLKAGRLARSVHNSIPGIMISEDPERLCLTVTASLLGFNPTYREYFNKDGSPAITHFRRDLRPGRSKRQIFFTQDGILIFRVWGIATFSDTADSVAEEHITLSADGTYITALQGGVNYNTDQRATQMLVGLKRELGTDADAAVAQKLTG